jgi:hypothetical protein
MLLAMQKAEETKKNFKISASTPLEERKAAFRNAKAQMSLNRSSQNKD